MIACNELTTTQLLALIAVNFAPIQRFTDGRWRSAWQSFPHSGVGDEDVVFLHRAGLVEWTPRGAIVTDEGRAVLQAGNENAHFPMTPARRGTQSAHPSLQ